LLPSPFIPPFQRGARGDGEGLGVRLISHNLLLTMNKENQLLQQYSQNQRNFSGINLQGATLIAERIQEANFSHADLGNTVLFGSNLSQTLFLNANLSGAILVATNLTDAILIEANLINANLSGAKLIGAQLIGAQLTGITIVGANLSNANLINADLSQTNLYKANLSWSELSLTNLSEANLSEADLSHARLVGANLTGADMNNANLQDTNFSGANLTEVNLKDTTLNLNSPELLAEILRQAAGDDKDKQNLAELLLMYRQGWDYLLTLNHPLTEWGIETIKALASSEQKFPE